MLEPPVPSKQTEQANGSEGAIKHGFMVSLVGAFWCVLLVDEDMRETVDMSFPSPDLEETQKLRKRSKYYYHILHIGRLGTQSTCVAKKLTDTN